MIKGFQSYYRKRIEMGLVRKSAAILVWLALHYLSVCMLYRYLLLRVMALLGRIPRRYIFPPVESRNVALSMVDLSQTPVNPSTREIADGVMRSLAQCYNLTEHETRLYRFYIAVLSSPYVSSYISYLPPGSLIRMEKRKYFRRIETVYRILHKNRSFPDKELALHCLSVIQQRISS